MYKRQSLDQAAIAAAAGNTAAGAAAAKAAEKHYTRSPLWIAGIVCVILGSLFDFAALAFVDQSVVAPLGSLTLVANVFFAPLLLKEKVYRKQLYCTALIISGSILAVAFAPHAGSDPSIPEMFANFARLRFIMYGLLSTSIVCALRYVSWRLNKIRRTDLHAYQQVAKYHTFCYAACAGIMGAQSVLFAKVSSHTHRSARFRKRASLFVRGGRDAHWLLTVLFFPAARSALPCCLDPQSR